MIGFNGAMGDRHDQNRKAGRTWIRAVVGLAALLVLATAGRPAIAADPGGDKASADKSPKVIDVATFTCEAAGKLNATDPKRYGELAQWIAGFLAEEKTVTDVSFKAIAKAGGEWLSTCNSKPAALLTDVAKTPKGGADGMSMAAMKCQDFLFMLEDDGEAAKAVIRWLDGWNARATEETDANFYDHKKQLQSATDGCMKYPKRGIMYVVAGRYR